MSGGVFDDLRDWGRAWDQIAPLTEPGALDEHQQGLVRLLRYRGNWGLREAALRAAQHMNSPCNKLVAEVLRAPPDDGIYTQARTMAAEALGCLLQRNVQGGERDGAATARRFVGQARALLDSPQVPFLHDSVRRLLAAVKQDACPPDA